MPLVFAYGSNLDTAQMAERCPSVKFHSRVRLYQHALAFTGYSWSWRGAVATIRPKHPKKSVPGVVWDVSWHDLKTLDAYEGVPNVYWRRFVRVTTESGRALLAHAYSQHLALPGGPSPEYFDRIANAYKRWGFDADLKALRLAAGTLNWTGRVPFARAKPVRVDDWEDTLAMVKKWREH